MPGSCCRPDLTSEGPWLLLLGGLCFGRSGAQARAKERIGGQRRKDLDQRDQVMRDPLLAPFLGSLSLPFLCLCNAQH